MCHDTLLYRSDCTLRCVRRRSTPPPRSPAGCVLPETLSRLADCLAPPTAPPAAEEAPPTAVCLFLSATTAEPPSAATAKGGGGACQYVGRVHQSVGGASPRRHFESQRGSERGGRGRSDPGPPPAGPLLGNSTTAPQE